MRKTSKKTCSKKKPYENRASALKALKTLKTKYGNKSCSSLHVYQCNICNQYHIGTKVRNINDAFEELKKERENA